MVYKMSRPITSLTGFVRKIEQLTDKSRNGQIYFRGHSDRDYLVEPSLFRSNNHYQSEHLLVRQLLASHPQEFKNDSSTFEKLVRSQHYGLPTRLLDVTRNPLVAMYFACKGKPKINGRILFLTPNIDQLKYFDSDTVSCLSNLCFLKKYEKDELITNARSTLIESLKRSGSESIPKKDVILRFNEHEVVDRLVQFIRSEKPSFRAMINPFDLFGVVSVVPRKLHARLSAQDGAFFIFGLFGSIGENDGEKLKLEHVDVDRNSKAKILRELELVGISEDTLFPEIDKSADQIKRRYS